VSEWVEKKREKQKMAQSNKCICNAKLEHTLAQEATRQQGHPATVASVHAHRPPPPYMVILSIHSTELGVGRELFIAGMFL